VTVCVRVGRSRWLEAKGACKEKAGETEWKKSACSNESKVWFSQCPSFLEFATSSLLALQSLSLFTLYVATPRLT
jgi:hypothetical protein